jgi:hypothetical protein
MLPDAWIDRIFDKLALTYGRAWAAKWDGLDVGAVKTNWANELAGLEAQPEAIRYGLMNLPADRPPTVLEFRAIARRCPAPNLPRLGTPKGGMPPWVREALACLRLPVEKSPDGKDWARRIAAKAARGEYVYPTPLRLARETLNEKKSDEPGDPHK